MRKEVTQQHRIIGRAQARPRPPRPAGAPQAAQIQRPQAITRHSILSRPARSGSRIRADDSAKTAASPAILLDSLRPQRCRWARPACRRRPAPRAWRGTSRAPTWASSRPSPSPTCAARRRPALPSSGTSLRPRRRPRHRLRCVRTAPVTTTRADMPPAMSGQAPWQVAPFVAPPPPPSEPSLRPAAGSPTAGCTPRTAVVTHGGEHHSLRGVFGGPGCAWTGARVPPRQGTAHGGFVRDVQGRPFPVADLNSRCADAPSRTHAHTHTYAHLHTHPTPLALGVV